MKTLVKFKQFVDEINLENGRNYKLSVLEKYKDDEVVKKYLQYVFDPFIVFGIAEKKLFKQFSLQSGLMVTGLDYNEFTCFIDVLDYLSTHNTGRDIDILITVTYIAKHIDQNLWDLASKIITKNLILGISGDTINKVFGKDTIRKFSVMLANKYFDKPEIVEGKTFVLTTKIDGMRCVMMKENGNVTFWSRQGQPIEGLVDLEKEAKECFPDNVVFDGELIAKETSKEDTYKNTMKTARTKDAEKHNLKMMVFDYMPLEDFKPQHNEIRYWNRRLFLQKIWGNYYVDNKVMQCGGIDELWKIRAGRLYPNMYKDTFEYFELLRDLYYGTDTNKIEEILKEQVANGEEGIMINIVDAPYEFKRTNNLLKVKLFNDTEVEITGFENGTNKNSNTLGNLICNYKGYELRVGSGFTDEERNYIWTHQDEYLGKLAVVKYFEETSNADGGLSLRFPVYKGIRLKEDL